MGANIFLITIILVLGDCKLYFYIEDKKEEKRKLNERKKNLNR